MWGSALAIVALHRFHPNDAVWEESCHRTEGEADARAEVARPAAAGAQAARGGRPCPSALPPHTGQGPPGDPRHLTCYALTLEPLGVILEGGSWRRRAWGGEAERGSSTPLQPLKKKNHIHFYPRPLLREREAQSRAQAAFAHQPHPRAPVPLGFRAGGTRDGHRKPQVRAQGDTGTGRPVLPREEPPWLPLTRALRPATAGPHRASSGRREPSGVLQANCRNLESGQGCPHFRAPGGGLSVLPQR